jgi:hypothetical protein
MGYKTGFLLSRMVRRLRRSPTELAANFEFLAGEPRATQTSGPRRQQQRLRICEARM